jgi:DNA sulfur modification protein DndC
VRKGESGERDRVIERHRTVRSHYLRQADNPNVLIFSPIIDFQVVDVWSVLGSGGPPACVKPIELVSLYWKASGDCPIVRDPKSPPCGKGRFGCWTCTVVRRDHSVENLVKFGYPGLKPLLDFRNWLAEIRGNLSYRCSRRRNGQIGLGPFTLAARRQILERLMIAQRKSRLPLIDREEARAIRRLWRSDEESRVYSED